MSSNELHIVHFNDVYEITPSTRDPVGGASRFQTTVKQLKEKHSPLVIFSGDAFSPSVVSSVTGGSHMIPILNEIGIHAATIGNHDFDFGLKAATHLLEETNFGPWMMANVLENDEKLFVGCVPSRIIDWNGIRVGLVGLVEEEWMQTVTCFPSTTKYLDQAEKGTEIAAQLRNDGAQIVIAVTHSRSDNDIYLAKNVKGVDLILGGHDHDYYLHHVNGIPILNSGSNFKQLTHLKVTLEESNDISPDSEGIETGELISLVGPRAKFELKRFNITSDIVPDEKMEEIVHGVSDIMEKLKQQPLGHTESIWDARAEIVRTQESAVGNFISDLMREAYGADVGLLQGGGIRSNDTYGPGELTMGDTMKMFPFIDCTVLFEIQGKYLREALENGFSQYPKQEGRFPQLSGCWVVVDVSAEPGERIKDVQIGLSDSKEPLDDDKLYKVASKAYAMNGGDGFTSFLKKTRVLVDEENGMTSANLIRNEFLLNKIAYAFNRKKRVDAIVNNALNIFKSSVTCPDSPIPLSASENKKKSINISVEGRIKFVGNDRE